MHKYYGNFSRRFAQLTRGFRILEAYAWRLIIVAASGFQNQPGSYPRSTPN